MGTRYSPSRPTPVPIPWVHLPYPATTAAVPELSAVPKKQVVGLKSVAQLTLGAYISGFEGITEVYNL